MTLHSAKKRRLPRLSLPLMCLPSICLLAGCLFAAITGSAIACAQAPASGVLQPHLPLKLLVTHAYLFTMAPSQRKPFLGYLAVNADGTIAALGAGDPPATLHAAQTWDAHGDWVMPGFISAHSHLWQSALRGLAPDQGLTGWIEALYGRWAPHATAEDFYWFTLDGALDHLQHGVTSAYDFDYGDQPSATHAVPPAPLSINGHELRAEFDSGIRFVHGIEPGHASAATATAPAFTAAQAAIPLADFLHYAANEAARRRAANPYLLSVMLNGLVSFDPTPAQATFEYTLATRFHLGIQEHYLEAPDTQISDRAKFQWMLDSGLVGPHGPHVIFGHFIHTTPEIVAAVVKADDAMSWNPLSNGRLASGIADIPAYLQAGLTIGMGVDGEASADLADPFENMRAGLYAVRDKYESAAVLEPYQVLHMATVGSAEVLGVGDRIGSLEPGKLADFLALDPAGFRPVIDPYATLVFVASQPDLARVYVGGELRVQHGVLQTPLAAETAKQVAARVARIQAAVDSDTH
jgi:5-methylthioadenosine/S-adenosylhomocysteine deaminase